MEKNQIAKGIEMVENERKIRDMMIVECEKISEDLLGIEKKYVSTYDGAWPHEDELSRSTKRELHRLEQYFTAVHVLGDEIKEYGEMLKTTRAERAEPVQSISV